MVCVWHIFSTGSQSLSFSSSCSQDEKAAASSDVAYRHMSDADVDGVSERVGEFTVWFDDFTRFDQQLHLLIDLNIFTDSDEQLLLLLKVSRILLCFYCIPFLQCIDAVGWAAGKASTL